MLTGWKLKLYPFYGNKYLGMWVQGASHDVQLQHKCADTDEVHTESHSSSRGRKLPWRRYRSSSHILLSVGGGKNRVRERHKLVKLSHIPAEVRAVSSLTIMYAFLFINLMKCSRHQKQHLRQQSRNRVHAFWGPGQMRSIISFQYDTVVKSLTCHFRNVTAYLSVFDPSTPEQFGPSAPQRGSGNQKQGSLCGNWCVTKQREKLTFPQGWRNTRT